jgi:hypothetical protein
MVSIEMRAGDDPRRTPSVCHSRGERTTSCADRDLPSAPSDDVIAAACHGSSRTAMARVPSGRSQIVTARSGRSPAYETVGTRWSPAKAAGTTPRGPSRRPRPSSSCEVLRPGGPRQATHLLGQHAAHGGDEPVERGSPRGVAPSPPSIAARSCWSGRRRRPTPLRREARSADKPSSPAVRGRPRDSNCRVEMSDVVGARARQGEHAERDREPGAAPDVARSRPAPWLASQIAAADPRSRATPCARATSSSWDQAAA